VTTGAEHAQEITGSRIDELWARVLASPRRARVWFWGGPIAVTLFAFILRIWNLGNPRSLVFDETFYVKDAWTLFNLGYEATWPENTDPVFNSGGADTFNTIGSFVVHPPLGKWLIALGMAPSAGVDPVGWRIAVALAGTLAVFLLVLIGRRLTGSTLMGVLAGLFLAIDGQAIVLSRVSILDGLLMAVILVAFYFLLRDREWIRARNHAPAWRPWLLAAGLAFGAACSIKWSGLYFLAAFGVWVVVMDIVDRRALGLKWWPTPAVPRALIAFALMVPTAAAVYIASWTGWIVTSGGYARDWFATHVDERWGGLLTWVPEWFQSLWDFHRQAYEFHVGLVASHPYQANPLTWLAMTRPTSMFFESSKLGENGCGYSECASAITPIPNPLIWYAAIIALVWLLVAFVRSRKWEYGVVLLGVAAGYLPWLMYLNRTVFQFYSIVFEPFLILALVFAFQKMLGSRDAPRYRRDSGVRFVALFTLLSIMISIFFFPIWTGMQTPFWFWQAHMWIPSWV
jgi:dolichyl-phosphate-mannose--protein O-mannosyl transferase